MHPDYLDYVVKQKVMERARWQDVKFLLRKLLGCELDSIYVKQVVHNDWCGWLVEFRGDPDFDILRSNVSGIIVLGERSCFIGVSNG